MANASTISEAGNVTTFGEMLPVDPFRSLYVHFGMLLGVEDFKTVDAYHRGKMWFHNGWLHRQGVIWGLKVSIDAERNEIRVEPGAAIDGMGRELYLQQAACLNLNSWYQEHKDDPELAEIITVDEDTGAITFDAHVIIKLKACLNRQVPALTEPCDGSHSTTAYSRVVETVDLCMLPAKAPEWRSEPGSLPYHRVRLLFALETALLDEEGIVIDADQDVLDARAEILALPGQQQPAAYLRWLRHFSVLDEMELTPASVDDGETFSIFPAASDDSLVLADLSITLLTTDGGWKIDHESGGFNTVDNTIRAVHIPTSTIQELVCGSQVSAFDGDVEIPSPVAESKDAGGPRIDSDTVIIQGEMMRFNVIGGPLMKASVDARGISVTAFDNRDGWIIAEIKNVSYDVASGEIEVELRDAPGGNLVRLIVKGTGPYPFMGRNRIPLAGAVGAAHGNKIDGNDFVSMIRIRS